ncbi:MAG: hypothetical protein U5K54_05755 [Cytophagales bacterium]|nr:hypothetical protein [Cytophagales bacterium]
MVAKPYLSMPITGISIALAIGLFVLSIYFAFKANILKEGDYYSFSRFQLWLWTTVIAPAFMLRWGAHYPTDIPMLNSTSLALLGLVGGTSLMSWIVTDIRRGKGLKTKSSLPSNGFWTDILADSNGKPYNGAHATATFYFRDILLSIFHCSSQIGHLSILNLTILLFT